MSKTFSWFKFNSYPNLGYNHEDSLFTYGDTDQRHLTVIKLELKFQFIFVWKIIRLCAYFVPNCDFNVFLQGKFYLQTHSNTILTLIILVKNLTSMSQSILDPTNFIMINFVFFSLLNSETINRGYNGDTIAISG